jgi:glutamate synthase (NADPH/NADH) small chain
MEERVHAREEGVRFEYLAAPLRIEANADGRAARVHFARMALGEPDASGRRRPVPTGEEFAVDASTVVVAIGYHADEEFVEQAAVRHERDLVVIDPETGRTNRPGVFAGGDAVNGADLVVTAVADGKRAAASIHAYLTEHVVVAA